MQAHPPGSVSERKWADVCQPAMSLQINVMQFLEYPFVLGMMGKQKEE